MKTTPFFIAALAVSATLLSSCSIEKRLYRDGFYVSGNHKKTERTTALTANVQQPIRGEERVEQLSAASVSTVEIEVLTVNVIINETVSPPQSEAVAEASQTGSDIRTESSTRHTDDTRAVVKKKMGKPEPARPAEGKSQLVAFLLCFFFGLLGIHRFYLGYVGIGLIQLFTLGGFGIWALIDLILIACGVLKPKNGEYK